MNAREEKVLIEQLYMMYGQHLWHIAVHYLNEFDAEDVVQEVMVELLERRGCFDDRSNGEIWSYLVKITRNRCIDKLKYMELKNSSLDAILDGGYQGWVSKEAPLDERLMSEDLAKWLGRSWKKLQPEYRIVMEYRVCEQMPSKEIAARMDLCPATVDQRICRGRKELKKMLKRVGYYV